MGLLRLVHMSICQNRVGIGHAPNGDIAYTFAANGYELCKSCKKSHWPFSGPTISFFSTFKLQ